MSHKNSFDIVLLHPGSLSCLTEHLLKMLLDFNQIWIMYRDLEIIKFLHGS